MQLTRKSVVAIDGPAGAGKSTVARQIAKDLGYVYIDTGAMYRSLTLKALRLGLDLNNEDVLTDLAHNSSIKLAYEDYTQVIYLDGENVSAEIRLPLVSQNVSLVAKVPGVRLQMVKIQRELAKDGGVIMDGRDIGSYVLPDAECKIFLTASVEERARRRAKDLRAVGIDVNLAELEQELAARDKVDSTREMAPLKPAEDAIIIDSSDMTFEEVVEKIKACVREKQCQSRGD